MLYTRSSLFSLVAQMVKHLSAMQKTQVQSLGWEDSPGEGNGKSLVGYSPWGPKELDMTE